MKGADQTVIAILLTMLLITSVVVGFSLVGLADLLKKRCHARLVPSLQPGVIQARATEEMPFFFERPSRWLAIRCSNILRVQEALGLHNPTPCPWSEGLGRLSEHKLFISPAVQEWVLVVGQGLPEPTDDIDALYKFLMRLGRELGSVQYFSADRLLNHHAWVRVENGEVFRAYAWAGTTLWNQGEMTAAERVLGMKCFDYGEGTVDFCSPTRERLAANCERILQLSARWSIDPLSLNSQNLKASLGIAGELTHR